MALMVLDPTDEKRLKAERQASGADRYDEVWDGVYMVAPLANNEHPDLQFDLAAAIRSALGWGSVARIHTGANVSDREDDGTQNYRIPTRGQLALAGRSDLSNSDTLASAVVPTSFRLIPGAKRPAIEVAHRDGAQRWLV